jgi:hypothetical protein
MAPVSWYSSLLSYAGSPMNIKQAMKHKAYDFLEYLAYEKLKQIATKAVEK